MDEQLATKVVISDRPFPVPIEMRPLWRICLILLSIFTVSQEKEYLDIKKINILVWMLIRKSKWGEYEDFLSGRSVDLPLVSVDTASYKAVEFAIAKEFVELKAGRLYLAEKGKTLIALLRGNEIMADEHGFLSKNGRHLTEQKVKSLTGGLI
ncbi:MAG: hypothetical protein RQ899_12935 [Pseudomonadales bacterium]|nr:hypothetical protein [Pseudomonadales bacterium]